MHQLRAALRLPRRYDVMKNALGQRQVVVNDWSRAASRFVAAGIGFILQFSSRRPDLPPSSRRWRDGRTRRVQTSGDVAKIGAGDVSSGEIDLDRQPFGRIQILDESNRWVKGIVPMRPHHHADFVPGRANERADREKRHGADKSPHECPIQL